MAYCAYCSGSGQVRNQNYFCTSCQGNGFTGGDTANRCARCGGSGRTGTREYDPCGWCGGTGIDHNATAKTAAPATKRSGGGQKTKPEKRSSPAGAFGVAGAIAAWIYLSRTQSFAEPWHPLALAGGAGLLAAWAWKLIAFVLLLGAAGFVFLLFQGK